MSKKKSLKGSHKVEFPAAEIDFRPRIVPLSALTYVGPKRKILEDITDLSPHRDYFALSLPHVLNTYLMRHNGITPRSNDFEHLLFAIRDALPQLDHLFREINYEQLDQGIKEILVHRRNDFKLYLAMKFYSTFLGKLSHLKKLKQLLGSGFEKAKRSRHLEPDPAREKRKIDVTQTLNMLVNLCQQYQAENERAQNRIDDSDYERGSFWESESNTSRITSTQGSEKGDDEKNDRKLSDGLSSLGLPREYFKSSRYDWSIPKFGYFLLQEMRDNRDNVAEDDPKILMFVKELKRRLTSDDTSLYNTVVHRQALELAKLCCDVDTQKDLEELGFEHVDFEFTNEELIEMIDKIQVDSIDEDMDSLGSDGDEQAAPKTNDPLIMKRMFSIGAKLIGKLDQKPTEANNAITSWNCLKIVLTRLLNSQSASDKKKVKWLRNNFHQSRIRAWNRLHFGQGSTGNIFKKKTSEELMKESKCFYDSLWHAMFGPNKNWERNPMVLDLHSKFKGLVDRVTTLSDGTEANGIEGISAPVINGFSSQNRSPKPLSIEDAIELQPFRVPMINERIYSNINLGRDIGLLLELPKPIAIHVVFKFLDAKEIVPPTFGSHRLVAKSLQKSSEFEGLSIEELLVAQEVTRLFSLKGKTESFQSTFCDLMYENLVKLNNVIFDDFNNSVVTVFYCNDEKRITNILRKYYEGSKDFKKPTFEPTMKVLVKVLMGLEPMKRKFRNENIKDNWAANQHMGMARLWNYKPFDRKVEILEEDAFEISQETGIPGEVVKLVCDKLKEVSRRPMILSATLRRAVASYCPEEHSVALTKLLESNFNHMIYS